MVSKKLDKKTLQTRQSPPKLTNKQAEVLSLILNEYMNPNSISIRLETSRQNIYQIISKIRKKGYLSTQNFNALQKATHVKPLSSSWSYHGLHFLVKPYYFYPRYFKNLSAYGVQYGDWVFKLHKDVVEVQSKSLVEFTDKDKFRAIKKAESSFNKALVQACCRFGFEVYKEGKANIRLVNHHLEFGNSDVAKGSKEHYFRIRSEQGKTWFLVDMSKGTLNHEYVDEVVPDSERLEPFFNDVRKGGWDDLKEIVRYMTVEYAENHKNHQRVLNGLLDAVNDLKSEVKNLKGDLK